MAETLELNDEQRMLIAMRDTLYAGHWGDFLFDLRARLEGAPHVFETVKTSEHMQHTIRSHIRMIELMEEWESSHGETLKNLLS